MRCNNKNVPTLILYHHKLFQIFPHCLAIFLPRKTDFGICVIRCVGRRRDLFGQAGRPVLPLGPCARIKADGPDRDGPSAAVFSVGKLRRASAEPHLLPLRAGHRRSVAQSPEPSAVAA
jgi:hypothetical protein